MSKLENKVAVVTGGSAGIGLATAKEFIAQGAKVVITGRNQQTIDDAVKELGSNAVGIQADAANLNDTNKLVEQVKSLFGKVDVLFVNAFLCKNQSVKSQKQHLIPWLTLISKVLFLQPKNLFQFLMMMRQSFI